MTKLQYYQKTGLNPIPDSATTVWNYCLDFTLTLDTITSFGRNIYVLQDSKKEMFSLDRVPEVYLNKIFFPSFVSFHQVIKTSERYI